MVRTGCMHEQWSVLLPMMESDAIDPPIGATYAVDDFGQALQDMAEPTARPWASRSSPCAEQ